MRTISKNTSVKEEKLTHTEQVSVVVPPTKKTFSLLTVLQKSNKGLFLFLMMVITLLPSGFTNASFYSEAPVEGNTFTTGCWVAPTVPTLVSLPDDAVIHQGNAWLSNPLMSWNASETSCPVGQLQYQFRVATDESFSNVVQTSDWLDVTEFVTNATSEGEYYWDVTVKDAANANVPLATASARHYTVDLSDLQAPVIAGWNRQTQSAQPNEEPTDLTCGATTNEGDDTHQLATLWSSVSGSTVKYQRELVEPDGTVLPLSVETNHYTPFFSLGAFPEINGLWKTRVRAFEDDNGNDAIDGGERVSAYSSYCELNVGEAVESPVVLNEILPDPQGPDNFALPFGEWIEIYNRTDAPIDVEGWKITADETNQFPIEINVTNTFPGLPFGVGSTVIPAHGFLVVYRSGLPNFDLKNIPEGVTDSETVRFFDDNNVLQDETTYTSTRENKSLTRIPDGFDNWVDPIPSPGQPNVLEAAQLDPVAMIAQQDKNKAIVALSEVANYQSVDVVIEYLRMQDGEEVSEALMKQFTLSENIQFFTDLYLGSDSAGTPNPHVGIKEVKVHVTLHSSTLPDKTIEAQLSGNWSSE